MRVDYCTHQPILVTRVQVFSHNFQKIILEIGIIIKMVKPI